MAKKLWTVVVMFEDFETRVEWEDSLPFSNTGGEMESLFFEGVFSSKKEAKTAVKEIESILDENNVSYQDVSYNAAA